MREDAEQDLAPLRPRAVGRERGTEPALVAREQALGVPSLSVEGAREPALHFAPVRRERPAPAHVARVQRDDAPRDAERAAEPVVVLRVIPGVAEQRVRCEQARGLAHGGRELGRVLTRPAGDDRAGDQVRRGVGDRGELRPVAAPPAEQGAAAVDEVRAHVVPLEARRVGGGDRRRREEAGAARPGEAGELKRGEAPPFSSRRSA